MDFDIKKYARLARIKLSKAEEKKFQKDLEEVLNHVEELKKVNVDDIKPMTGGTILRNVFREDKVLGRESFEPNLPEKEKEYLRVPKVFDND